MAPKVDCEEKPDCPSQEEKDREVPERKVGEGVSCTKGLLDTGFRQYKRTRVFALPSVESGDVLLLSARYLSGLLRQSSTVAITDVSGTGIASASTFADENLSLVAKASMDGPHFLLLFIDGCSAKGEERYEFQVVRRGQKSADAVLFFGSSDANDMELLWFANESAEGEDVMHKFEPPDNGACIIRIVTTAKRGQGLPGEKFDQPPGFQFRLSALPE